MIGEYNYVLLIFKGLSSWFVQFKESITWELFFCMFLLMYSPSF